jgi:hypothetical protein
MGEGRGEWGPKEVDIVTNNMYLRWKSYMYVVKAVK